MPTERRDRWAVDARSRKGECGGRGVQMRSRGQRAIACDREGSRVFFFLWREASRHDAPMGAFAKGGAFRKKRKKEIQCGKRHEFLLSPCAFVTENHQRLVPASWSHCFFGGDGGDGVLPSGGPFCAQRGRGKGDRLFVLDQGRGRDMIQGGIYRGFCVCLGKHYGTEPR